MKRKGFTLVELLTVIAILAIILLIASPIILNVLEKAKQNTFKNQALLYVEGVKQKAVLSQVGEGNIVLPSVGESVDVDITTITLEIDKGYTGVVRITNENGKYKYTLVNITGDGYTANGPTNNIVVTKAGQQPSVPTYTAYTIGQQVTLKDNSVWYVIEDSGSDSDTVTLFASQNIKNDGTRWTTVIDEYRIAFDGNNSNVYENSSIKRFIDNQVKSYINNSLTSNKGTNINSLRLLTKDEYNTIKDNAWSYSTNYWTMTPYESNSNNVYNVNIDGNLYSSYAGYDSSVGNRPVIVTLKSNIK